ncbi:flagellar hook-length control protein FliK [Agarivorans sp.]|uniref:flagellar hook-length control protein FliK n=1 Tax=Agarivorans sp. TaxID=1872412 RepID=UPI003D0447F9
MEFLLTDSANGSQLGSLHSASLKPVGKSDDFANLVKDLKVLPSSVKALGLAKDKQILVTESAAKGAAEPASPLELLKQLDNAKQVAEDLSATKVVSNAPETEAETAPAPAEATLDLVVSAEQAQADAEQDAANQANSDGDSKMAETSRQLQAEQSGTDLPPNYTASAASTSIINQDAKSSSGDAETELLSDSEAQTATKSDQQAAVDTVAKSVETQVASAVTKLKQTEPANVTALNAQSSSTQQDAGEQVEQAVTVRPLQSEKLSAEDGKTTLKLKAEQQVEAKLNAAVQATTDKAQINDKVNIAEKTQVADEANSESTNLNSRQSDLSAKVSEAGKAPEAAKAVVSQEQKPLSSEQAKAAATTPASAAITEQLDESKLHSTSLNRSELSYNQVGNDKNSAKPTQTTLDSQPEASAVSAKSQPQQQTSNEAGVKLVSEQANTSEHATRLASEAKPSAAQPNTVTATKTGGAQAQSVIDKAAVNQAAGEVISQQSDQHGSDEHPDQQTQGHSQQVLHAAESARQPEAASLFRPATSSEGISRAESSTQDLGLKQAQLANQANDKASFIGERLNPAHYQAPAELNQRVQYMLSQGMQKAEIRLDPAELGSMHVRLQMNQDQQVTVHIQVQNPQAKEALEQTMPRLREMLQQQGIELGQNQVSQQQQGNASHQGQGQTSFFSARAENTEQNDDLAEQDLTAMLAKQTNSDGIDYYA